jgi:hypothetical protein
LRANNSNNVTRGKGRQCGKFEVHVGRLGGATLDVERYLSLEKGSRQLCWQTSALPFATSIFVRMSKVLCFDYIYLCQVCVEIEEVLSVALS